MAMETKAMELKNNQPLARPNSPTVSQANEKTTTSWVSSLEDLKGEFSKITWTNPDELKTYTKIVVGAALFLGLGIYCADIVIRLCLMALENVMRWIS